MSLYYCINDILDTLDKAAGSDDRYNGLTAVSGAKLECNGYEDDSFTLENSPKLLDLRDPDSIRQLSQLVEDVPLYGINLELVLDEALSERHTNSVVENALNQAFNNQPLPNTLKSIERDARDMSGGLQHPMIGHLDKSELCQIYVTFLGFLDRGNDHYGFERNILGKHIERFLERFDGYVDPLGRGKVKAGTLITFGLRLDHDLGKPMETHVQDGKDLAQKMKIEEPHELVWAWLEAENFQMRRCRDLDRVMRLADLPRIPNWVRNDIFACLQKEAMKQVFAEALQQQDAALDLLKDAPSLQRAMMINAQGQVAEPLQQLMTQILNHGQSYAGGALKFADNAALRNAEAKKTSLG